MTNNVTQQEYCNIKCYALTFKYYIDYINIDMFTPYNKKRKLYLFIIYFFKSSFFLARFKK